MNKVQLRQKFLKQRKALSLQDWQEKSDHLCQYLCSSDIFQKAQTILAYFSINQEPNLNSLLILDKKWGFSRCVNDQLEWHFWQDQDNLEIGKYGIKTPLVNAPKIETKQVDLILVPAVACDHFGYRLGYGGGYYDRLFSNSEWEHIPKIGIIFDFAYVSRLSVDPWDQKLQGICTELGFYNCY